MITRGPWKYMGKGLLTNANETEVVGTFHSRNAANRELVRVAPELFEQLQFVTRKISDASGQPSFTADEYDAMVELLDEVRGVK